MAPKASAGNHSLFNNKTLSDVTIKFCNQEISAHKSFLVSGSEYFYKAFTGGFPVATSGEIDLGDEDDAESIIAMIRHLYDLPYDQVMEENETSTAAHSVDEDLMYHINEDLMFHVNVFTAADKYDVPTLRAEVVGKFRNILESSWERSEFVPIVKTLCGSSAAHLADRSLQATTTSFCSKHLPDLINRDGFEEVLQGGGSFVGRLLTGFVKNIANEGGTDRCRIEECRNCNMMNELYAAFVKPTCACGSPGGIRSYNAATGKYKSRPDWEDRFVWARLNSNTDWMTDWDRP